MAKLLISFCNVFPHGLALGRYKFDSGEFRWVDISAVGQKILGVTGLCFHEDKFWFLAQLPWGGRSALVMLDKTFQLRDKYLLAETHDAHSMIPFDNGFLVNDTIRNRLTSIQVMDDRNGVREMEYWRYCDEQTDTVHVNSVAQVHGQVCVSMFGPKPEEGWGFARNGSILNVSTNSTICENLFHPHSLMDVDGALYWLESGTGLIHRFSGNAGHEVVARLAGYVRGICYDPTYMYVAASAARRRSKSTGIMHKTSSLKTEDMHSWIYRINRENLTVERRALTTFGAEVYDLVFVRTDDNCGACDSIDPIVLRTWKCEDEHLALQASLEEQTAWARRSADEVVQRDAIIRNLQTSLHEQTGWAKRSADEVVQRDAIIRNLQTSLHEQSAWATRSADEVVQRDAIIRHFQVALEEQTAWAKRLTDEVALRDATVRDLHSALAISAERLAQRDAAIHDLQAALQGVKGNVVTLRAVHSSSGQRALRLAQRGWQALGGRLRAGRRGAPGTADDPLAQVIGQLEAVAGTKVHGPDQC